MDIAEVAQLSGLPASTLRYYEERGLIASTGRSGLRRRFGPRVLDRLAVIALGRAAGFSLDEIAAMFTREGGLAIDRAALVAKADEIERNIKRLQAVSNGLRHAAVCKAPSHLECASFQRYMAAASHGALSRQAQRAGKRKKSQAFGANSKPAVTRKKSGRAGRG
ncbi:MAG: helix-turn-helix domain-containing protein [Betaproteobacteria bacterium]|nr:helix-turn-helix domain-containing protein [Betaproteobacteria bacterium]